MKSSQATPSLEISGKNSQKNMQAKQSKMGNIFFLSICVLVIPFFIYSPEKTELALLDFLKKLGMFLPILLLMLVMMEGIKHFVSRKNLAQKITKLSGWKQVLGSVLAGIFSMGSLYLWYPLLQDLKNHGFSYGNIATFIYARAIKPVFFPVLFFYFDWKYVVALFVSLIIFSVIQGKIIQKFLEKEL